MAHEISLGDLNKARQIFEANEPRDLFYRAATVLVDLARKKSVLLTVAEALAVLLQTWNKAHYQYRKFDNAHFASIERLLSEHKATLTRYRNWDIEELDLREKTVLASLFQAFEEVLGPVGSAKALHLLAPRLFPLWDRAIAKAHGLALGRAGTNGDRYWDFVLIAQHQCRQLKAQGADCQSLLKSIDEYNYCRHTKGWLS